MLLTIAKIAKIALAALAVMSLHGLYAQGWDPNDPFVSKNVKYDIMSHDIGRQAVLFATREKPGTLAENYEKYKHANKKLGGFATYNDIGYKDLDAGQYEICCGIFNLSPRPNEAMAVLYFDGKAAQFPLNDDSADFVQEFRRLGWAPLAERLDYFMGRNPYNQEALAVLLSLVKGARDGRSDGDVVAEYTDVLKRINECGSADWMTMDANVHTTMRFFAYSVADLKAFKENQEFQREFAKLIDLLEKKIKRNPNVYNIYTYWAYLSHLMKDDPDPMKLLSEINFPPGKPVLFNIVSSLVDYYFDNLRDREGKDIARIEKGLKILEEGAVWIEAQDSDLEGGIFANAFPYLASKTARTLIRYKRYPEVEKYLGGIRLKTGSKWPAVVNYLRDPGYSMDGWEIADLPEQYKRAVDAVLDLPALEGGKKFSGGVHISHNFSKGPSDKLQAVLAREKFNAALAQDAGLPQNSWSLFNAGSFVSSGAIAPSPDEGNEGDEDAANGGPEFGGLVGLIKTEARKNLGSLERFIRQNPENYDAIDMYCEEAAKFLPDEELEAKMFGYAGVTRTAPSQDAAAKMGGNEQQRSNWARLASLAISEGLEALKNSPRAYENNPWERLDQWEGFLLALNANAKAIDWHGFMDSADFWYAPMYYAQADGMSEGVFIKYLAQAQKAGDWDNVLLACQARYNMDKASCREEDILAVWEEAEARNQGA